MLAALGGLLFLLAKEVGILGEGTTAKVDVPSVITLDRATAVDRLEEVGLKPKIVEENNSADAEVVFEQNPQGGTRADKDSEVIIKVSLGAKKVEVPNVVGKNVDVARDQLEDLGFKVNVVEEPDDDADIGEVIKQSKAGGSEVSQDETIVLTVSSGKDSIKVPNVVGMSEDTAADELVNAGFKVQRTRTYVQHRRQGQGHQHQPVRRCRRGQGRDHHDDGERRGREGNGSERDRQNRSGGQG